ncbi:DUF6314 family protein [uncultured Tateyamaria sp.]|uniref:DUF6314 family protein n=1 Tax=uncultured Tateyamaria sp. TaxID=455651 RepID=UPI0026377216|nr:DUF6314 family protein [uncultured Tateyamaria sp.]
MPTERTLADFAGLWVIERAIVPRQGSAAQFMGKAEWTPTADGLDYIETGTLHMEGAPPMQAERRYRWTRDLSVYFDDGRFFHKVPAFGGRTPHFCDPDTYVGTYDFGEWPDFTVSWDVRGPRKDYQMISTFTRRADP